MLRQAVRVHCSSQACNVRVTQLRPSRSWRIGQHLFCEAAACAWQQALYCLLHFAVLVQSLKLLQLPLLIPCLIELLRIRPV